MIRSIFYLSRLVKSKKPSITKAVRATMPKDIAPMAMTLAEQPFSHKDWLYEIKWDGYRTLAYCSGN